VLHDPGLELTLARLKGFLNIRLPKDYYAAFQALPPEQRTFAGLAKIGEDDDEVQNRLVELVRFGLQLFNIPEKVRRVAWPC